MKKTRWTVILFLALTQCGPDPKKNCDAENSWNCQTTDPRLFGDWKLAEEIYCFNLGGDCKWEKASKDFGFSFREQCIVKVLGDKGTDCYNGRYSIDQNKINVTLICSDCSTTNNGYEYTLNARGDTLLLEAFVDDGYFGSKYYSTKQPF